MDFESLSRRLMDAATDPALWTTAMDEVALQGNAVGAVLLPLKGRARTVPKSASLEECLKSYVQDGWHLRDNRDKGIPLLKTAGLFFDQNFASETDLKKSDYYRGFLAPFEANWSAGIGVTIGDEEWCLVLERGDRHGAYQDADRQSLLRLGATIRQAAMLSHHLSYGKAIGIGDAFDLIGCASILIDRDGKVLRCNREAEKYIPNDLFVIHRELHCHKPDETAELRRMVQTLCAGATADPFAIPRDMIVSRPMTPPFIIQGIMLRQSLEDIFSSAGALLFIVDPFRDRPPGQVSTIARMFKMTPAEKALLTLLEQDTALPQAAEQLGISYETARTQLKNIFDRTDTRRQSELIGLVRRLTPTLRS